MTVQQILNDALSLVLGEPITTTGAGRTDAGVHATLFCAHFESTSPDLSENQRFIFRLNGFLPADISVTIVRRVLPDANARFSAMSRTYRYFISRVKDPFSGNLSWYLYGKIDMEAMNQACAILFRHDDFTSFSRLHSGAVTNICHIYESIWEENDRQLIFTIKSDRFLRNMVRAIVGTMIDIGTGKMDLKEFEDIILAKDRCLAGTSAPARGLFLTDIEYPPEIFT
jgi:tRNA pseudouridine38-40 synthase